MNWLRRCLSGWIVVTAIGIGGIACAAGPDEAVEATKNLGAVSPAAGAKGSGGALQPDPAERGNSVDRIDPVEPARTDSTLGVVPPLAPVGARGIVTPIGEIEPTESSSSGSVETRSADSQAIEETSATFSHDEWTEVLQRFVDADGRVDYVGLSQHPEKFQTYLRRIHQVGPKTDPQLFPTKNDELAYYINGYNALIFEGVIARGPEEESVWKGLISGLKFFKREKFSIEGEETNLSDLENDIIRAKYQDPRIHAALNCASVGCPRLPQEAFLGASLDRQLDAAMHEFCNSTLHVDPVPAANKLRLSQIFEWFRDDFVDQQKRLGLEPTVPAYINRYRDQADQLSADASIETIPYDKAINKQ